MNKTTTVGALTVVGMTLVAAVACQAPAPPPPDWASVHAPLAEAYVDAWTTGNLDQLDAAMAADVRRIAPPSGPGNAANLAELKGMMQEFRTAWPDARVVFDESYYLESVSFHRWTFTGTNTGEGQTPPTGRPASVSGMTLLRYADGKIVEEHAVWDALDFMQQLGFELVAPGGSS